MRDVSKVTAPSLSTARKATDPSHSTAERTSAAPSPAAGPTPVTNWADSVPEEFQTPVFGGQAPPEAIFAAAADEIVGGAVCECEFEEGLQYVNYGCSAGFMQQALLEADHAAAQEWTSQYEWQYVQDCVAVSYQSFDDTCHFTPPPPPQDLTPELEAKKREAMLRWYGSITLWVEDAQIASGVQIPPAPPMPDERVPLHLLPYSFDQWRLRVEHWYNYIVAEYFNNYLHPEQTVGAAAAAKYPTGAEDYYESPPPQPSYACTDNSNSPYRSQQYYEPSAPAMYKHDPYQTTQYTPREHPAPADAFGYYQPMGRGYIDDRAEQAEYEFAMRQRRQTNRA